MPASSAQPVAQPAVPEPDALLLPQEAIFDADAFEGLLAAQQAETNAHANPKKKGRRAGTGKAGSRIIAKIQAVTATKCAPR